MCQGPIPHTPVVQGLAAAGAADAAGPPVPRSRKGVLLRGWGVCLFPQGPEQCARVPGGYATGTPLASLGGALALLRLLVMPLLLLVEAGGSRKAGGEDRVRAAGALRVYPVRCPRERAPACGRPRGEEGVHACAAAVGTSPGAESRASVGSRELTTDTGVPLASPASGGAAVATSPGAKSRPSTGSREFATDTHVLATDTGVPLATPAAGGTAMAHPILALAVAMQAGTCVPGRPGRAGSVPRRHRGMLAA